MAWPCLKSVSYHGLGGTGAKYQSVAIATNEQPMIGLLRCAMLFHLHYGLMMSMSPAQLLAISIASMFFFFAK